jgi:hypothetical protein
MSDVILQFKHGGTCLISCRRYFLSIPVTALDNRRRYQLSNNPHPKAVSKESISKTQDALFSCEHDEHG